MLPKIHFNKEVKYNTVYNCILYNTVIRFIYFLAYSSLKYHSFLVNNLYFLDLQLTLYANVPIFCHPKNSPKNASSQNTGTSSFFHVILLKCT